MKTIVTVRKPQEKSPITRDNQIDFIRYTEIRLKSAKNILARLKAEIDQNMDYYNLDEDIKRSLGIVYDSADYMTDTIDHALHDAEISSYKLECESAQEERDRDEEIAHLQHIGRLYDKI